MPRLGKHSAPNSASVQMIGRNGQLKFYWSSCCELDVRNNGATSAGTNSVARSRNNVDELGALLDKALAFAG